MTEKETKEHITLREGNLITWDFVPLTDKTSDKIGNSNYVKDIVLPTRYLYTTYLFHSSGYMVCLSARERRRRTE